MYLIAHKLKLFISSGPLWGLAVLIMVTKAQSVSIVAQDQDLIYLSDGRVEFISDKTANFSNRIPPGVSRKSKFEPTVLSTMKEAHNIYQRMRADYQEKAECTNMAHVWAYEEFKSTGIKTQKMFLFFTRKYILEYRFPWWFHVAPAILVKDQQVILDRRYTTLPLDTKTWTNHFVLSGKECKQIQNYSTYWNYKHRVDDCFLMLGTMYDWQPRDLRLKEQGVVKESFRLSDLRQAYQEAF